MTDRELLEEYSDSVRRLRKQCLDLGVSDEEFRKMYFENLNELQENHPRLQQQSIFRKYRLYVLIAIILLIAIFYKSIYSCLICNMQEYIYPGLRLLRKISIPLISLFPSLTDLYQETCLIQNPFFTVVDMDCWPCSTVHNIAEILNPQQVYKEHSAPFIYKTDQPKINIMALQQLYIKNKDLFDKECSKIFTNNKYYVSPEDIFNSVPPTENLYIWKLNNFNVARTVRQIIPRPKVVPKFGQSTERFIIIDSKHETFHIPDTECNYAFLLVLHGSRTVNLRPAEECKHQCKSFKIDLKESYLLWYNWWYWRPLVEQTMGNETFIAHVGSYC